MALASLGLTILHEGKSTATAEANSMILGSVAFLVYAFMVSRVLLRRKLPTPAVALCGLLLWIAGAVGLWYVAGK